MVEKNALVKENLVKAEQRLRAYAAGGSEFQQIVETYHDLMQQVDRAQRDIAMLTCAQ